MKNKIQTINLDKERHLRLGINGLIELEKMLNRPVSDLANGMGMNEFRAILFIALKWEDKSLTEYKTGELMDLYIEQESFEKLGELLGELVSSAMGVLPSK